MNASPHPLPAAIGRTENALRALLLSALAGSRLPRYEDWAALNLVAGQASTADVVDTVSGSLSLAREAAVLLLGDLVHRGLLTGGGPSYGLSHDGAAALSALRPRVAERTRPLLDGLAPQDIEIALRVLDEVRSRADRQLARFGR